MESAQFSLVEGPFSSNGSVHLPAPTAPKTRPHRSDSGPDGTMNIGIALEKSNGHSLCKCVEDDDD